MPSITADQQHEDGSFLIFSTANQVFALPHKELLQIVDSPHHTALPLSPPSVRGVIDVQGETLPLIDLRVMLGSQTLRQEIDDLAKTVAARRQDHVNWLTKLKDAVYNGKEITVQTDPHKCNFGLWYDRYEASSATFSNYMKRFDRPHKAVHDVAVRARDLMGAGKTEQARELVHDTENTILKGLLALFDGFEAKLRKHTHEYALVAGSSGTKFAIAVDSIVVFDRLHETTQDVPASMTRGQTPFVTRIGRLQIGGTLQDVMVLDAGLLYQETVA